MIPLKTAIAKDTQALDLGEKNSCYTSAGLDEQYDHLLSDIEHQDIFNVNIAGRMDKWTLGYLMFKDETDQTISLPGLFEKISRFNNAITSKIIQNSITRLETNNNMVPPLPFCWISMGSDARGEQVIRTDQDNALIYADPIGGMEEQAKEYFQALAKEVTCDLDRFGFTLCKGDVMATNPEWCRSLGQWLVALDDWVGSTSSEAVRKLTILLDFKPVFGDNRLAATLQTRVFTNFEKHESASHFLVRDDQLFAPPKTRFNRIRTVRKNGCAKCFNLKTQAIAHIVNGARLFAVNHGIRIPSTLERLKRLKDETVLTKEEFQDFTQAFIFLTRLKLTTHLDGSAKHLPSNCIDLATLETDLKKNLNKTLDSVARFQKKMADTYNQAWMNFFN
ncbi:MAG: DUF294 nucleotidyltransferase-like domain-containing protein [Desulfobacterales bacterium]|nr:DUF294 nucleotidyltransferase-like domain-containing protein [Desulfobacterales bacterium]